MKVTINDKQYELVTYKRQQYNDLWQVYVVISGAERFCDDGDTKSEAINNAILEISLFPNRYQE